MWLSQFAALCNQSCAPFLSLRLSLSSICECSFPPVSMIHRRIRQKESALSSCDSQVQRPLGSRCLHLRLERVGHGSTGSSFGAFGTFKVALDRCGYESCRLLPVDHARMCQRILGQQSFNELETLCKCGGLLEQRWRPQEQGDNYCRRCSVQRL